MGSIKGQDELMINLLPLFRGGSAKVSWSIFPNYPTFRHYLKVILDSPEFWVLFWNSVKITIFILLGQLFIGVPAAWGFAKYNFRGKKILFFVYIILMMMPFQVKMLPEYLVLDSFRLLNSHSGIILPAIFSTYPVFIMYQFFVTIPQEVIEAAKIDGANDAQILLKIGLHIGKGGIVSAMLLQFIEYWNLIEQPLVFLETKSLWPLSMYLPTMDKDHIGTTFVVSIIALIPLILLFFNAQEYLQKGISAMIN